MFKDMKGESWACSYLGKAYFRPRKRRYGDPEKGTPLVLLKHSKEGRAAEGGRRKWKMRSEG